MSDHQLGSVLSTSAAIRHFGEGHLRWMVRRGMWQQPARGVVVRHSGTLTTQEVIECELLAQGPQAVLAGLTAANLDGLRNHPATNVDLLVPHGTRAKRRPGVVVHRCRTLSEVDVHPAREPRRTKLPRSIIDAASWATSEIGTHSILAASVQQGLTTPESLETAVDRLPQLPKRQVIIETIRDIAGGSLSEYEVMFVRMCRRHHLPMPSRQVQRRDSTGRLRYLDAEFDDYNLVAEIDGQQHMDPLAWWEDMARDNELVVTGSKWVLRFPGFVLRRHEARIAGQLRTFINRHASGLNSGTG